MLDFVHYFSFAHFLISLKILQLSWLDFYLPRFPNSLNGVLHTSVIAPRMIHDVIFWICCLPEFIACFILASKILLTSHDVWLASLGAKLFKPCIAVLTVSLPALAKLDLFKNPPRCCLLADRLGLNLLGFFNPIEISNIGACSHFFENLCCLLVSNY